MSKKLDHVRASVETLAWVKRKQSELKVIEAEHRAIIEEALGDDELGTVDGTVAITWSTHKKRQLDQSALKEANPELVESFTNLVEQRTFKVVDK